MDTSGDFTFLVPADGQKATTTDPKTVNDLLEWVTLTGGQQALGSGIVMQSGKLNKPVMGISEGISKTYPVGTSVTVYVGERAGSIHKDIHLPAFSTLAGGRRRKNRKTRKSRRNRSRSNRSRR